MLVRCLPLLQLPRYTVFPSSLHGVGCANSPRLRWIVDPPEPDHDSAPHATRMCVIVRSRIERGLAHVAFPLVAALPCSR